MPEDTDIEIRLVVPPTPEFLAAEALYHPPDGPDPSTVAFAARLLDRFPDHPALVQEALDQALGMQISEQTEAKLVTWLSVATGVSPRWVPNPIEVDSWPIETGEVTGSLLCQRCGHVVSAEPGSIAEIRADVREHAIDYHREDRGR